MKLILIALTLANLALILFGGSMAMLSPMMFDAGGQQDSVGRVLVHLGATSRGVGRRHPALAVLMVAVAARRSGDRRPPAVFAVAILAVIFTK